MAIQIRRLTPADAQNYQALRLRGLQECPSAFAASCEEECDIPISAIVERLVPTPDRCILGAFNDAILIGVVGLQREELRKLAHKAWIGGMYVAPEFRRQHVGRQLLKLAIEHARLMSGVKRINLGVNARNIAAIALYESMGFKTFGIERDFLLVDGSFHDELHMVRVVDTTDATGH